MFKEDLDRCETAAAFTAFESYTDGQKQRAIRLYAMLASYLRGRPLKMLRSVTDSDGFKVWRQLHDELAPKSRPRTLATFSGAHALSAVQGGHQHLRVCAHVRTAGPRI